MNWYKYVTVLEEGQSVDCSIFALEPMAPKPVTLEVRIYGEKHRVTYPSQKHVDELLRESLCRLRGR